MIGRNLTESKWLDICAIGRLKELSNVSAVNKRLMDRGFRFTTSYMGGKSVLWSFESVYEKEGFIKNIFWDTFMVMEEGSVTLENQPKPVWISIARLPLRLWNVAFFQKLGGVPGDLLFIESETLHRRRLDRARLLIAIPGDRPCPSEVRIKDGSWDFPIQMEIDLIPVDFAWLVEQLDLKFEGPYPEVYSSNRHSSDDRGSMEDR
ncbi:hypothetical protein Dsin_020438 [Dipteronia sinensis]|uniref:DUF4283 domain-containing protein n=1 Tax=Dipteronia sinensis TaxID=43782 RepID=A0AAE0A9P8_9ROSI|nr:hypothetical protein Dsin_020438 [Dipteronia sinensis]